MSVGLAADILHAEIEDLETTLGEGNPLGESRVSVRAADLKLLLEAYDSASVERIDRIAATHLPREAMMGWLEELLEHLDDYSDITDGGGGNNYMRWHSALLSALSILNKHFAAPDLSELLKEACQLSLDELFAWQAKTRTILAETTA